MRKSVSSYQDRYLFLGNSESLNNNSIYVWKRLISVYSSSSGISLINRQIVKKGVLNLEFCPKCGSRLIIKKSQVGEDVEIVLACSKCNYEGQRAGKIRPKLSELKKNNIEKSVTVITKEDQKMRTLPTLRVECPKCGNNLVYVWQVQTRGGDESSTQFMRCTKCEYTFREYT